MLTNIMIVLIISMIIVSASVKLIIDKKNGVHCHGCPYSGLNNCSGNQTAKSSCQAVPRS
jgi:hypothetical protein